MALDAEGTDLQLAGEERIEWIEGRPVFEVMNSKGIDVMNALDADDREHVGH